MNAYKVHSKLTGKCHLQTPSEQGFDFKKNKIGKLMFKLKTFRIRTQTRVVSLTTYVYEYVNNTTAKKCILVRLNSYLYPY